MTNLGALLRYLVRDGEKGPFIGKLVIEVRCDGCMAHDHKLVRVGEIVDVKQGRELWPDSPSRYHYAVCRTVQSREDSPEEFFHPCLQDSAFQAIPSGAGFIWRR